MPEDSPIPDFPIAATSKVAACKRSYKRKKARSKVKRAKGKSTLKNQQKEMKHSSSGADEMDGGMESHQPELRVIGGADGNYRRFLKWCDSGLMAFKDETFKYSKMALDYYNGVNWPHGFEVVQALHAQTRLLYPRGTRDDPDRTEQWCHVFFVARSKIDGTEKNFFAELAKLEWYEDDMFDVESCSILEPGDFDHGCLICPPGLLLHPQKGQFLAHKSSFTPVKWVTI